MEPVKLLDIEAGTGQDCSINNICKKYSLTSLLLVAVPKKNSFQEYEFVSFFF